MHLLPAADYLGCVKAMSTKSLDIPSLRLIEGTKELTGNKFAEGFIYAGAGNCRQVTYKRSLIERWSVISRSY